MAKKKKNKMPSIEVPAGAVYALLAAISLICFTVLAVVIADDNGGERGDDDHLEAPQTRIPHLYIEDVFFRGLEGSPMRVEMTLYLTNDGTMDAENVKVDAWPVMEKSNIAKSVTTASVDDIAINNTASPSLVLYLEPDTVHSVEIIVFESKKIVLRGRSTVSTSGSGGSEFQAVEVRKTADDADYDGIPDDWEEYYGLNPNDPTDAGKDPDRDGLTNLEEYRLMTDPVDIRIEPEEGSISTLWGIGEGDDEDEKMIGASLFLILIVGVIAILIGSAVYSHRRGEKRSDLKSSEPMKDGNASSGPFLDYEVNRGEEK